MWNRVWEAFNKFKVKFFGKFNFTQWNINKTSPYIGQHTVDISKWTWIPLGSRNIDPLIARFKSCCVEVNEFLFKIKQTNLPDCPNCINIIETIHYFVCFCPKYTNSKNKFLWSLAKLKINVHNFTLTTLFTGIGLPRTKYVKVLREFYRFIQEIGRDNL